LKRRRRSVLVPVIHPLFNAIAGAAVTPPEILRQVRMLELAAIDAFARGSGDRNAWAGIKAMVNICRSMAEARIGPEAIDACNRADAALKEDEGRSSTTPGGLQAYRDVHEYHDIQRQSIARSEYEKHINRAENKALQQEKQK
jgi:hypothetical protein